MGQQYCSCCSPELSVDDQITDLAYFITQKQCKLIPRVLKHGIETAKVYGRDGSHQMYKDAASHEMYDINWVYTEEVSKDDPKQYGKIKENGSNCIIKISATILNDEIMRQRMMINAGWMMGHFNPKRDPHGKVTLFFGGNETIKASIANSSKWDLTIFDKPKFSGDTCSLVRALEECFVRTKRRIREPKIRKCEVMFRDDIPLKYIEGNYQYEDYYVPVNKIEWKPLTDFKETTTSRHLLELEHNHNESISQRIYNNIVIILMVALMISVITICIKWTFKKSKQISMSKQNSDVECIV